MTADVDLHGAAALVGRSYSWFQKHWRDLRHEGTGEAFPRPYIGGGRGQKPRWIRAAIDAWKLGAAAPAGPQTSADLPQRAPSAAAANDARPRSPNDRASALRAAAGG